MMIFLLLFKTLRVLDDNILNIIMLFLDGINQGPLLLLKALIFLKVMAKIIPNKYHINL